MGYLQTLLIAGLLAISGGLALAPQVGAINVLEDQCRGANQSTAVCESKGDNAGALIGSVVNILMFILGAVSTIMIVIGGIKYVTSNGDSSSIQSAKNTIMYAVIGLVVAISASAIVAFVLGRL